MQIWTYAASPDGKPQWTDDFLWLLDLYDSYAVASLTEWFFWVIYNGTSDVQDGLLALRMQGWFRKVAKARTNLQGACWLSRQLSFETWKKEIAVIRRSS